MSCQRGNVHRSRSQKYKNSHAFKNTLHDTSTKTKMINTIQVVNVCERCKSIIEWKIKYKKYKALKAPGICTKCKKKCVKHAYHIMCEPCALHQEVCSKCGEKRELIKEIIQDDSVELDRELRLLLKTLPERKRRTFMRYMHKRDEKGEMVNDSERCKEATESTTSARDDLLEKLKSLMICSKNDDECADDFYDDSTDDDFDDDL